MKDDDKLKLGVILALNFTATCYTLLHPSVESDNRLFNLYLASASGIYGALVLQKDAK